MATKEIEDVGNEATVTRYRYERYDGAYTSQTKRILSFIRFEIKEKFLHSNSVKRSLYASIIFWFVLSGFISLFLNIYWMILEQEGYMYAIDFLSEIFGLDLDLHSLILDSFYGYFTAIPNAIPFWLFIASVCAQSFYPDYENRTVEDYFSRISRKEYLISKFIATYSFIVIPFLILMTITYFWFASALRVPSLDIDNLVILITFNLWVALLVFILTLFGLFLSTNNKQNTVIILFFVTMFFTTNFTKLIAYSSTDIFHLLNVAISSRTIMIFFSGRNITEYTIPFSRNPDLALQATTITIIGISVYLLFYIVQKVLRKDP